MTSKTCLDKNTLPQTLHICSDWKLSRTEFTFCFLRACFNQPSLLQHLTTIVCHFSPYRQKTVCRLRVYLSLIHFMYQHEYTYCIYICELSHICKVCDRAQGRKVFSVNQQCPVEFERVELKVEVTK